MPNLAKQAFRVVAAVCLCIAWEPLCAGAQVPSEHSSTHSTADAPDTRPHLAVVGFQMDDSADARDAWLATAIEETLAWRLRRVPGLVVIPTVRLHQARLELTDEAGTAPDWPHVALALGADLMLTGRCNGPHQATVIHMRLGELGPNAKPRGEVTLAAQRLFDSLDTASRWVLDTVGAGPIPAQVEQLIFAPPARSPSALEYYARAVAAARTDNLKDGGYYVQRALEYDIGYRPALAMLAQLELLQGAKGLAAADTRLRIVHHLALQQADPLDVAAAELGRGTLLHLSGAFDAAYTHFETSLAMSYERQSPYGQIAAANSLCDLYLTRRPPPGSQPTEDQSKRFKRQNMRRAAEWQESSLNLLKQLGDVVAEMPAANKLALICEQLDEGERALVLHQRTLTAAKLVGSRRHQATAWLNIGQWYQRQERWAEALDATNRCLELASASLEPVARLALAGIYQSQDAPAEALQQFEQACEKIRAGDDLHQQLICAREIAELRMRLGRRAAACASLEEAIDIAHALQLPEETERQKKLAAGKDQSP